MGRRIRARKTAERETSGCEAHGERCRGEYGLVQLGAGGVAGHGDVAGVCRLYHTDDDRQQRPSRLDVVAECEDDEEEANLRGISKWGPGWGRDHAGSRRETAAGPLIACGSGGLVAVALPSHSPPRRPGRPGRCQTCRRCMSRRPSARPAPSRSSRRRLGTWRGAAGTGARER